MAAHAASDSELVGQVLAGRREAFAGLVERYLKAATAVARVRLANPADTEDAVQEAFLRAFERLGSLQNRAKFGPWLLTIARHEAVRIGARGKSTLGAAEPPRESATELDPARAELGEMVRERIADLPELSRDVLMLHYFAGHTTREIADLLGVTHSAVLKRLERARGQLAESLLHDLEATRPTEDSLARQVAKILAVTSAAAIPSAVATSTVMAGGGILSAPALTKIFAVAAGVAIAGAVFLEANPRGTVEPESTPASSVQGLSSTAIASIASDADATSANTPVPAATFSVAQQEADPAAAGEPPRAESATLSEEAVAEVLAKRHSLTVEGEHLARVLERLSDMSGVQFLIDTQAVGVPVYGPAQELATEPYVTDGRLEEVTVEDMPITELIQRVAMELGLEAVMEPNYVWISTRENIAREVRAKPPNNRFDGVLQTPVSTAFVNQHLTEIVDFITGAHELNIALDQRAIAPPGRPATRLTLPRGKVTEERIAYINLKKVPLTDAVELIARLLNVTMVIQPDYIWLSSRDQIRTDGLDDATGDDGERIRNTLKNPVSIVFEDIEFAEIAGFFSKVYRVSCVLDQRVVYWRNDPTSASPLGGGIPRDGLSHGMYHKFSLTNLEFGTILDIVLRQLDLAYTIDTGKFIITNKRGLASLPLPAERLASPGAYPAIEPPAASSEQAPAPQPAAIPTGDYLRLHYIQPAFDGSFRASIECGGVTKLYAEGEAFMQYKVLAIDSEKKCVTLLDEKMSEELKLCV